ncbi:MAG: serine/threonine protein kinase [Acidobacteria bacterium]|nr:MAG: serine/threonine protein kinase [Acidobacteriota bacterium]
MPGATTDSQDFNTGTPEPENEARERLGKYEIVEKIGDGGFGVVYQGYDPYIKRYIALKTCTSPDSEVRERFFREAEISGRLDHPNIVRVLDFGIHDDTPFLVQEFLQGQNLDRKIRDRTFLPYSEQLLILMQIARGLEYAHSMGVIHRDVKPSNVQILDDGTAKIMDFGIAILHQMDSRVTQEGMAVGTAAYLAPEQIRGEPPDPRTDIFSYGVLAYELVTGERPFGKDSISATFYEILNDDPVPISGAQCPAELRTLIHRCLQKDANRRYDSFKEVLRQLSQVRDELQKQRPSRSLTQSLRRVAPDPSLAVTKVRPQSDNIPIQRPPRISEVRYQSPGSSAYGLPVVDMRSRKTSKVPLVLLILILLGAGVTYWWLEQQEVAPPIRQIAETIKVGGDALVDDVRTAIGRPSQPEETPAEVTSEPEGEVGPEPAPVESASEPPVEEAAVEEAADQPAVEEETPPELAEAPLVPFQQQELEPSQATLVVSRSWHKAMTVSVDGGPALSLTTPRNLELEPGNHVLLFALRTPSYRSNETVDVSLEAGEKITVKSPIAPPGSLSVQASLGSPQGVVSINGKPVGATPFQGHLLKPGSYRMTIRSVSDSSAPGIETTLNVQAAKETVVTFDMTGERELQVRRRPIRR